LRPTLVLVLIALGLGLYTYFGEIEGEQRRKDAEDAAKRLLAIQPDEVTALEVTTTDGDRARLVRSSPDEAWQLETPVAFPADPGVVSDLLASLSRLAWESRLEDLGEDLAAFGLGEDRRSIRLWTGEDALAELYLGADTPIGSQIYVALAGDTERVLTVPKSQVTGIPPRLFDLRDKRLVRFEPDDVQRMQVLELGTQVVALERVESDPAEWRLVAPTEDGGDAERIDRLLQDLVVARATDFVDSPGPLAEYGLDLPEIDIRLETADAAFRIQIGRVQDKAFLRVNDGDIVFETSDRLVMGVPRRPFAFRYKQVFDLDEDRVARIQIEFPREDASYGFVREEHEWKSEAAELEITSLSVADVLWAIEDLEATGIEEQSVIAAKIGLEPARVRVRAFDKNGEALGWLELGDPLKTGEAIAARSSQSDRIWRVQKEIGEDVPLGLEAFERNFLKGELTPEG
jgi:hypothetical protein